jgi:Fe-S oxidoreductase
MFLSGMTEGRSLMSIAPVPFRDIFPTIQQKVDNPKGRIAMFTGCLLDFAYVDIAKAVIADLNSIGYVVDMPMGQSCCGAPATFMGDRENAKKTAELNVEAMHAEDYDYVVSACPTCTHQLRVYKDFFEEGSEMYKKAEELGSKTFDFCKLFYDLGGLAEAGDETPLTITYHDSCHLKRELGVFKEQRELLKATKGINLVEMEESDVCCGFGGTYSIKLPEVATPILGKKIQHIKDTGASLVAVDCPGCLMQIRGGMDANDLPIEVKHTAVILAEKRGLI